MTVTLPTLVLLSALGTVAQADVQPVADVSSSGPPGTRISLRAQDHPHADTLRAIVERLGSANFDHRVKAADRLRSIGSEAYGALREAYHLCDDYEVRLRIQEVTKNVYFDENLLAQNGFLGVALRGVGSDDQRVEAGHTAMHVASVITDTAAERVGLKVNDLIVRLDDDTLEGIISVAEFSQTIRNAGPGAMMRLGVYRGQEFMEMDVVLGRRPIQYYANQGDLSYPYMLIEAEVRFTHFWQRQFAASDATPPSDSDADPPAETESTPPK